MDTVNGYVWKEIGGYDGCYEINSQGEVRSIERKIPREKSFRKVNSRILKTRINNSGYLEVRLTKNSVTKTKFIHILKAEAFIPNPENKKEVNHKNGNKLDNDLENLEWVTHAENVQHAYKTGLIKLKTKTVIDTCSGEQYTSAKEAAKVHNINYGTLRNYLSGNIKSNKTCLKYAA